MHLGNILETVILIKPKNNIFINKKRMKKMILVLALLALTLSCKRMNEEMGKIDAPVEYDSTHVAKDSTIVDSTAVKIDTIQTIIDGTDTTGGQ